FSPQLKELPGAVDITPITPSTPVPAQMLEATRPSFNSASHTMPMQALGTTPDDHLKLAQGLLEKEMARTDLAPSEIEALREILFGLREHNPQRVGSVYRSAFAEITSPSEAMRQAYEHITQYFAKQS